MKILLSADFHSEFKRLYEYVGIVDLCICCGDIFDYHRFPQKRFEFPLPFYSIKGNKELWGGGRLLDRLESFENFFWLNQHLRELEELTDIRFFGIDYVHSTKKIPNNVEILITHMPAYGLADQCSDTYHATMAPNCGSKHVRRLVDKIEPLFVIAGHVHYYQTEKVGKTTAITLAQALNEPVLIIEGKNIVSINN
ncbi:MAG: metallophosphoesterase [Candidatus Hodarchaeota archaeon]